MIISYEGREYPFEEREITVDEWRALKREYSMTPLAFERALPEADPDAVTFLWWLLLRRSGDTRPLGDHLTPDVIALHSAYVEAATAALAQRRRESEPDPTTGPAPASPAPSPSRPAASSRAPSGEVTAATGS